MDIRKLTDKGLMQFRQYLSSLKGDPTGSPPYHILTDPEASIAIDGQVTIEERHFETRLEVAGYLDEVLAKVDTDGIENDIYLWSWMSLFFFEQVCPEDRLKKRKPGRDYRHIPEPGYPYGHRHLLAGAYMVFTVYGLGERLSRLLLHTPPSIESQFHHELATRQSFITNRGIMEAAHRVRFLTLSRLESRGDPPI